jgi:hypothetical protein
MDPFGWNYPPGLEHDKRAPWNQADPDEPATDPDDYEEPDRTEDPHYDY